MKTKIIAYCSDSIQKPLNWGVIGGFSSAAMSALNGVAILAQQVPALAVHQPLFDLISRHSLGLSFGLAAPGLFGLGIKTGQPSIWLSGLTHLGLAYAFSQTISPLTIYLSLMDYALFCSGFGTSLLNEATGQTFKTDIRPITQRHTWCRAFCSFGESKSLLNHLGAIFNHILHDQARTLYASAASIKATRQLLMPAQAGSRDRFDLSRSAMSLRYLSGLMLFSGAAIGIAGLFSAPTLTLISSAFIFGGTVIDQLSYLTLGMQPRSQYRKLLLSFPLLIIAGSFTPTHYVSLAIKNIGIAGLLLYIGLRNMDTKPSDPAANQVN